MIAGIPKDVRSSGGIPRQGRVTENVFRARRTGEDDGRQAVIGGQLQVFIHGTKNHVLEGDIVTQGHPARRPLS